MCEVTLHPMLSSLSLSLSQSQLKTTNVQVYQNLPPTKALGEFFLLHRQLGPHPHHPHAAPIITSRAATAPSTRPPPSPHRWRHDRRAGPRDGHLL
jgi:hypothetical protein